MSAIQGSGLEGFHGGSMCFTCVLFSVRKSLLIVVWIRELFTECKNEMLLFNLACPGFPTLRENVYSLYHELQ